MNDTEHKNDDEAANDGGLIFPEEVTREKEPENLDLEMPTETKLDRKETYAGWLAAALFLLFTAEIVAYIAAAFILEDMENMHAVFQVIFPVTSGFLASAVTYYLSTKVR